MRAREVAVFVGSVSLVATICALSTQRTNNLLRSRSDLDYPASARNVTGPPQVLKIFATRFFGSPIHMHLPCDALPNDITCEYVHHTKNVTAGLWHLPEQCPPDSFVGTRVGLSMEGSHYYPKVLNPKDQNGRPLFDIAVTYRQDSEIPIRYGRDFLRIRTPPPANQIPSATFLARNCNTKNHRANVTRGIARHFPVVTPSGCLSTHRPRPMRNDLLTKKGSVVEERDSSLDGLQVEKVRQVQHKDEFMKKYMFHLAFENGNLEDYVTEKVYQAFEAGTIPVYYGAPNVEDFVPKGSIINVGNRTGEEVGELLATIAKDPELVASYHKWKYESPTPAERAVGERFEAHWTCRLCQLLVARERGLSWDWEKQTIVSY